MIDMGDGARGSDFAALTMTVLPRSKCYVGQVGGAQASLVVRQRNTIRLAKTFRAFRGLAGSTELAEVPPTKRIGRLMTCRLLGTRQEILLPGGGNSSPRLFAEISGRKHWL